MRNPPTRRASGRRRALAGALVVLLAVPGSGCKKIGKILPTLLGVVVGIMASQARVGRGRVPVSTGGFPGSRGIDPRSTFGPVSGIGGTTIPPFDTTSGPMAGAEKFDTTLGTPLYLPAQYRSGPRFLLRKEWDGAPPSSKWKRDGAPRSITIHHSAAPDTQKVKVIRDCHVSTCPEYSYLSDVAYHFLITKNGDIYEGRPLGVEGGHSGPNQGRIGICLVGHFSRSDVNDSKYAPMRASLEHLVKGLQHAFPATRGNFRPHGMEKGRGRSRAKDCPGRSVERLFGSQWASGFKPPLAYAYAPGAGRSSSTDDFLDDFGPPPLELFPERPPAD